MNGGNSTPTKMLKNSIKLNIHTYLVQECGVECWQMEELTFLHEVVCLHLSLALQVDEGGVGLVNGVAVWLRVGCLFIAGVGGSSLRWRRLLLSPKILFMVDELAQVYGVFA